MNEPTPVGWDGPPNDIENPEYPLDPIDNPDVVDASAPWASSTDEESDDGKGPKPMTLPDDIYSEDSSEEPPEPKGTVLPVWLMLTVAIIASVAGSTATTAPTVAQPAIPPLIVGPTSPGAPPVLPNLPVVPNVPCVDDAACSFIMGAIDPVFPPQTRALLNIPGICQNWSREWLRTGKDVMEFQVERIRQRFAMALMYCEFNGDNWLEGELWVSELHEYDDWRGSMWSTRAVPNHPKLRTANAGNTPSRDIDDIDSVGNHAFRPPALGYNPRRLQKVD